jgi:DNA-binding CsgD family transcriptional regulator
MEFLEREPQLQILERASSEVFSGTGRLVLVSGEAGVGKTTLVKRFAENVQSRCVLLWGACDASFTPRPLSPCYDFARQGRPDLLPLLQSGADWLGVASALLSGLVAKAETFLVVFEDVHWADEATLDLIKYLGRRIEATRALLILTYRDDELGPQHKLKLLLGDLATYPVIRRIQLAPLSPKAVRELAKDTPVDPALLYQQTNGNPFFVTEVLAGEGAGIPATVRDAVLARAARLSLSGRAVLEAAAVIGPRVEIQMLAALASSEITAIEECMAVGMLQARGDFLGFRHELARQTVLDAISTLRKRVLHRQALAALEEAPEELRDLARMAHHAEQAEDPQAVLRYAPPAAQQAVQANAHREAAAQYARALRFDQNLPIQERALLLEAYATECSIIDQINEAIAARRRALEIWKTLGNPLKQGENLAKMVGPHFSLGQNNEAERASRAAIEILETLPPSRELALAYREQAFMRMLHRDNQEAIWWGEKAIALAERFNDQETVSDSYNAIGCSWLMTDFERGRQYLEKSIEIAKQLGHNLLISNGFGNLGSGAGEVYHHLEAYHYLTEGIAFAKERDIDRLSSYMQAWQALAALHKGRWGEAEELARELLKRPGKSEITRIMALLALGRLRLRRGDPGVWDVLDEALTLAQHTQTLQRIAPARAMRAEAAWLAGDHNRAREEAGAAYDFAVSKAHPWFTGELAFWRRLAGEELQPPDWVAEPFARFFAGDWGGAAVAWETLGCPYEAALALSNGDTNAQITALETFERLGARPAAELLRRKLRFEGAKGIPRGPRAATRRDPLSLTPREREILDLLVQGLSNPAISTRLHLSSRTVEHHVSSIFSKLGVQTRSEAIALVLKPGRSISNPL